MTSWSLAEPFREDYRVRKKSREKVLQGHSLTETATCIWTWKETKITRNESDYMQKGILQPSMLHGSKSRCPRIRPHIGPAEQAFWPPALSRVVM